MDIEQTLTDALQLANDIQDSPGDFDMSDAEELASYLIEIDHWLNTGGSPPVRWGRWRWGVRSNA